MKKKQIALKVLLADIETPVSAFMKLCRGSEDAILLESVYHHEQKGRFSIIGIEPLKSITLYSDRLEIREQNGVSTHNPMEFFDIIRKTVSDINFEGLPYLPGVGCLIGYIGYDAVRLIEEIPKKNESKGPIAQLMIPSVYVVFDHLSFQMTLASVAQTKAEAEALISRIENRLKVVFEWEPKGTSMTLEAPNEERFKANVLKAKEMIKLGEVFQLVLSADFTGTTDAHPFDVYRNLRADSPSPYMFYLKYNDWILLGSSPETLVKLSADRVFQINPIAGTRARSENKATDDKLAEELKNCKKERAEHTMLVDLARNDAGRVCEYGSIKTDPYMLLVRYSHVMHLVSEVKGKLAPDLDAVDAFKAGFPAGTVTGAPKIRAMELIDEIEDSPRGPYAGAVGYFSSDGSMDTCIAIRIAEFKGQSFKIRAGAGIVAGSTPEGEYKEIENKAKQTIGAVQKASGVQDTIIEALKRTVEGKDLNEDQVTLTMEQITSGEVNEAKIVALLVSLRMKGETVYEITGAARVLRQRCTKIPVNRNAVKRLTDTCGTGGDALSTFNISTVSAFVAAGAGLFVAKHGNRSVTSSCGSADLIEALGIPLDLTPAEVGHCIEKVGIGFMFAPLLHGSMKHVAGPRKDLKLRTIFNILGPLVNPAGAETQLLGVFDEKLTETMACVLQKLGCESAYVVYGADGLDEISISAPTKVSVLKAGRVETFAIEPEDFGMERRPIGEIKGGCPSENAKIALSVLKGEKGARRDIVVLNTAAALAAGGLADSIEDGVSEAVASIDSGKALAKLSALVEIAAVLKEKRAGQVAK